MTQPTPTLKNVLVGVASLYLQPYDPASPATLPPDTLAAGSAWPSPWAYVGGTDEGVKMTFSRNTVDIRIEEQSTPVLRLVDTSDFQVSFSLAEATLASMKYAYGGGTIVTTAAATGVPGTSELTLAEDIDMLAVGFEGKSPQGFWRRFLVPIVSSTGSVETGFRRAAAKQSYPTTLSALCPLNAIDIRNMNEAAL